MKASSIKKNGSGSEKGSNERSGGKTGYKMIDEVNDGFAENLKNNGFLDI